MPTIQRERRKTSTALRAVTVLIILMLLFTNAATIYLLIKTGEALEQEMEKPPVYITVPAEPEEEEEQDDVDKVSMPVSAMLDFAERDKISIEFLQRFFDDRIIVWSDNRLHSIPIDDSLKKSDFNSEYIVADENSAVRRYEPNGEDTSLLGVDVSSYQGSINWRKVKAAGVDYAIIRLGYRGYGTGAIKIDTAFHTNMTNAIAAGVPVGVYFYSQAVTVEEAVEEAETVIKHLASYKVDYPVAFDMEEVDDDDENVRTSGLTVKERTDITIAFCEKIREAGYTPMVYGNIKWMAMNLDLTRLEDYDKWFAQYFKQPFFPYQFSMWQYTPYGRIDGIPGSVDLNMGFVDYTKK